MKSLFGGSVDSFWVSVAGFAMLATSSAFALDQCDYDVGGEDCGNGTYSCAAGYLPSCNGTCVPNGSCFFRCVTCNCIPGYSPGDSIQVNNGTNQNIIAFCSCKNVSNSHTSGKALMVPTKTSTEWSAFFNSYSSPRDGVTVTAGSCF